MMNRKFFFNGVVVTLAFAASHVSANDGETWCQSFTAESGISDAPCSCVVEAAESEPDLGEELYSYTSKDEYDNLASSELRALLADCLNP